MGRRMDTEAVINGVVELAGGCRVDSLLPEKDPQRPENADYLFQYDNVIAELKTLQQAFTPAYYAKVNALLNSWSRRGLIRVYGRVSLNFRRLPLICQQEWLRLLTSSLQRVILGADKQIRTTNATLNRTEAQGLLLLANDGHFNVDPYNLISLATAILRKRNPDGSLQYSSINAASFFSASMLVSAPGLALPSFFWFNGVRESVNDAVREVQAKLEASWYEWLSRQLGFPVRRIEIPHAQVERLRYI